MRFFISVLFVCLSSLSAFSQGRVTLSKANNLIAQKKYLSAYKVLDEADPENRYPRMAIAKTNLLMKYHISTDNYYKFGLKNLEISETIDQYEEQDIKTNITFYPDTVLNRLIKKFPNKYSLQKTLGSFYYEIHLHYPNNSWLLPDSTILKKIKKNYLIAYQHNEYDYWSLFGLGYVYLLENNYEKAISFLETSLVLNPKYALTYYNLASAYYNLKEENKIIEEENDYKVVELAKKAYDLQYISYYKTEAARLLGLTYYKLKKSKEAYPYLKEANQKAPNDYNTLVKLLNLELEFNKEKYPQTTKQLFLLSPENPVVYKDILEAYKKAKKIPEYTQFLENQKSYYRTKKEILANIVFYTAVSLYETKKWTQAKINFEKARQIFSSIYEKDHTIFKVIDSYTDVLKKK